MSGVWRLATRRLLVWGQPTFLHVDIGLFHGSDLLLNNSVIMSIDSAGLFCLTPNGNTTEGNWFLPGSSVPVINADDATSSDQVKAACRCCFTKGHNVPVDFHNTSILLILGSSKLVTCLTDFLGL